MAEIFSPNMLKIYSQCPHKYRLKYADGISMPVNSEVFLTGKNIHALASYYLKGENIDRMEKALNPNELKLWEYLKDIHYFQYKCINTEYDLAVKLGGNYYGGRLDALMMDSDRYYILDYKTGSVPKNAEYDYQTMIYMLAVSVFYNTDSVTFVYLDLKNQAEKCIILTHDLKTEYEKILLKVGEKIISRDYHAIVNNCKNCEYGKICYEKLPD